MTSATGQIENAETGSEAVQVVSSETKPKLWTVKDAGQFLRVSERKLRQMLKTPDTEHGSLPHVRLGRSPRFIPTDIEEWAACGFPPASVFKAWKNSTDRRRKRNDMGAFLEKQVG